LEEERERYLELWLTALEEVSTLRWKHQQQKKVIVTLAARRGHAQKALDAARNRFVLGDQNYLDVLTALRGLQEADRSMVSERRQLISLWIRASESIGQPMCNLSSNCKQNWQF
jgi:outer membrane protein TolC